MDQLRVLDACRRDRARLVLAYRLGRIEPGAVRLYCEPQPGELLIEAGNLIERMAAGKEAAPVGWGRFSQERRSDVLARRLTVESDAARQIAQRVMWRLARMQHDGPNQR